MNPRLYILLVFPVGIILLILLASARPETGVFRLQPVES